MWHKADSRLHNDPSDADIRDRASVVLNFIAKCIRWMMCVQARLT